MVKHGDSSEFSTVSLQHESVQNTCITIQCDDTGHSGHNTVDHTAQNLPGIIKRRLLDKVERQGVVNPEVISDILKSSISSFDGEITQGLLDLFPGGAEAIQKMSDEEIQAIVVVDGRPHPKLVPAMSGTTALVALVDPGRNLYVASLGDCQSGKDQLVTPCA